MVFGSCQASLTSSRRSWMKRSEEPEPRRAPWASSSTLLARCRVPSTSSTLPSTAFARFLQKGGEQPGVSVEKGTEWKSSHRGKIRELGKQERIATGEVAMSKTHTAALQQLSL